jgi:hypothetical protein
MQFDRAYDGLLRALEATPDDRLNWSPSPTSRTPIHIVVHCANAIGNMQSMMMGAPWPSMTIPEMDQSFRDHEANFHDRAEVIELFKEKSKTFLDWIAGLSDEDLEKIWHSPFGDYPISFCIQFPALHTQTHVAQLQYIQTIYGDMAW